jgi:hypothetical protein
MRYWRELIVMMVVLLLIGTASAQEAFGLTADEITILNRINNSRLRENLVHLMPSDALNRVANAWVEDLTARPIETLGDVYLTRSRQTIEDLLGREGFAAYPDGYTVDFIPIVVRDFGPSQIVDFWISDFRQPQPQLRTRRNIRFSDPQLPIFSALYREIGIAWRFSETTQRHYYVIIFGAEPNVLPVIAAQRSAIDQIAQTVAQREVVLYIHDERVNRFGLGDIMGAVEEIRISEQRGELACDDPTPDWQPYNNEVLWSLSPGAGLKTVYVQMCDSAGRSVLSSVQVTLTDASAAPDVMSVVRATQTAAAQATVYAPYQPTIQAILTATASASETPTP